MRFWQELDDFPSYIVSDFGRVGNKVTGKVLKQTLIQYNVPTVGLVRDGVQYRRSVAMLVAKTWIQISEFEHFNTPTHLDGDRQNCFVNNLVWRPRWFAIAYHREQNRDDLSDWTEEFILVETGEFFKHPRECAIQYGIMQHDIAWGLTSGKSVFPHGFTFRWA